MKIKTAGFELSKETISHDEVIAIRNYVYRNRKIIIKHVNLQVRYQIQRTFIEFSEFAANIGVLIYFLIVLSTFFNFGNVINRQLVMFIGLFLILVKIMLFNFDCVIRRNIIISGFSMKSKIINLALNKRLITVSEVHLKYLYINFYHLYLNYLGKKYIPKIIRLKRDLKDYILFRFVLNLSESCNILKFSKMLSFQNEEYQEWSLWKAFILDFELIDDFIRILFINEDLKVNYIKQLQTKLLILNPEFYTLLRIHSKIIRRKN